MLALRILASVLAAWIMTLLPAPSQALPAWLAHEKTPPPPENGIRDKGGFFRRNPDAKKRIAADIYRIRIEHGYKIILLVEPVLISSTPAGYAAELQQAWVPDGNGLVIVFEADSRKLGFGRSPDANPGLTKPDGPIPTHETTAIIRRAVTHTDPSLEPQPYIEHLVHNLADELADYYQHRDAPPPRSRTMRTVLLTTGAFCFLGLAAIGISLLTKLPTMSAKPTYRFPDVDLPERLGAPCGGGNVTVRSYRSRTPAP